MEVLVDKISRVQEGELGVSEFQVAVLTALLSIMQDQARPAHTWVALTTHYETSQENLNKTLTELTEERLRMKLEQEQAIISDSSDSEQTVTSKNWTGLTTNWEKLEWMRELEQSIHYFILCSTAAPPHVRLSVVSTFQFNFPRQRDLAL